MFVKDQSFEPQLDIVLSCFHVIYIWIRYIPGVCSKNTMVTVNLLDIPVRFIKKMISNFLNNMLFIPHWVLTHMGNHRIADVCPSVRSTSELRDGLTDSLHIAQSDGDIPWDSARLVGFSKFQF